MAYLGNSLTVQQYAPTITYFSGNGSTTAFTLPIAVVTAAQIIVTVDNVIQNPSTAFSVSGTTLTFTSAPLTGTNNIWVEYTSLQTNTVQPAAGSVNQTSFASITGTGATVLQTSPTITTPTLTSPVITGSTPQTTVYTSGSGTYTVPTSARYLQIIMVGGGAGGWGAGTTSGGSPGSGTASTFGSNSAGGGVIAGSFNANGGVGGTSSLSGATGLATQGGSGGGSVYNAASGSWGAGGNGGNSALGGGASGGASGTPGASAAANTGGGGGGGGTSGFNGNSGAAGGGGGYINAIITSPSATYSYAVGSGGSAGPAGGSGTAGGAGGSGVIMVTAYF